MKFMHLGDLHLGRTLGDFSLIEDQKYILEQLLEIAKEQGVDAIFLAGDIYDKSIPSEAAVQLLDTFLSELANSKIKTYMISGNHDSEERLHFGSRLFEENEIHISAKYQGKLEHRIIQDSFGEVHVYLLPFVKASKVKGFYPEEEIQTYDDAVRVILEHAQIDTSQRNILIAHQFVAGKGVDIKTVGSEGLAVQNVGLVEQIGYDSLEMFDYVALGHIHGPQKIGRDYIRYSGSPLKYSLTEANNDKSVPIVTIEEKGKLDISLVTLVPKRDVRHLKGTLEQLLDPKMISAPEDYIYVTLTNEDIVNDAMGIFQQYYPNTVKIDYDNSHTKELEQIDITNTVNSKSFTELISDFYSLMYGCEITEEEMVLMKEVAREAGVEVEAD